MRIIRTIALGAGASALVLGMAAPAMAVNKDVTQFPGKVVVTAGDTVTLKYSAPAGAEPINCAGWTWQVRVVGQKKPVTPGDVSCENSVASVVLTISEPANKKKKANAVAKLIATQILPPESTDTPQRMVMSTVIKVNPTKGAKPANSNKPKNDD